MYCAKCGKEIPDSATVCSDCGTAVVVDRSNETVGLLSMIFGIVGLGTQVIGVATGLSLPAAIAAVICGFLTKARAAEEGKTSTNAQAGIVCGFVTIGIDLVSTSLAFVFLIFYFVFMFGILGLSMGAEMYI